MNQTRRRRYKSALPHTVCALLLTLQIASLFAELAHSQLTSSDSSWLTDTQRTYQTNTLASRQQYPSQSSSTSGSLVNPATSIQVQYQNYPAANGARSLPLTRQQTDLDDVIESTTSLMSIIQTPQQQPFVADAAVAAARQATNCQLPPTWAGKWYQANKEPIRVTNTEISDKGLCRDQKGDKYLFEYNSNAKQLAGAAPGSPTSSSCLICLVINQRHLNVLQYKESSCQPPPPGYYNRSSRPLDDDHSLLDSICSDITGDAQLESLFRLDTPAIECPISGQFSFTYDGCREPHSALDSCIDKKQLSFKFASCPDVPGSESKSEVLKCHADWSEGSFYYMIGRLENSSNLQDRGKFRCYVYEKSADGKLIQMAQSLEESCYGLINANEGPKTLRLVSKPPTSHKCNFPSFIQSQSENWLSVDNSLIYMFNQNSTKYQVKETKEGNVIEEATCLQQFTYPSAHAHPHHQQQHTSQHSRASNNQAVAKKRYPSQASSYNQADQSLQQASARSTTNDIVYLVQITKNCHTTNYCVRFYRRSNGIVQIDYFNSSPNADNQCRNAFIGTPQTQIITSTNLEHQRCPFEGVYTIEAPPESDLTYNPSNIFMCPRSSFLTAQCDHPSRIRVHSKCSPTHLVTNSNWTTNGLVRLLLVDDDRQRYSAWYRDYGIVQATQDAISGADPTSQAQVMATRSQQLLAAAATTVPPPTFQAPIIDLQIALITTLQIVAKPMQVRLTRRNHCSELRGYTAQGTYGGSPMSPSMQGYSATPSSSGPSMLSIPMSLLYLQSSILMLIVTLLLPYRHLH